MNVLEVKKKVKDKRIQEIMRKIDHHEVENDDEWIQFAKEMDVYVKTDIPEDVRRLFYPLGYLERATIIIDGIIRWRNSICKNCIRQKGYEKYSCSVYKENKNFTGGIPSVIWASDNPECPYFEPNNK